MDLAAEDVADFESGVEPADDLAFRAEENSKVGVVEGVDCSVCALNGPDSSAEFARHGDPVLDVVGAGAEQVDPACNPRMGKYQLELHLVVRSPDQPADRQHVRAHPADVGGTQHDLQRGCRGPCGDPMAGDTVTIVVGLLEIAENARRYR